MCLSSCTWPHHVCIPRFEHKWKMHMIWLVFPDSDCIEHAKIKKQTNERKGISMLTSRCKSLDRKVWVVSEKTKWQLYGVYFKLLTTDSMCKTKNQKGEFECRYDEKVWMAENCQMVFSLWWHKKRMRTILNRVIFV